MSNRFSIFHSWGNDDEVDYELPVRSPRPPLRLPAELELGGKYHVNEMFAGKHWNFTLMKLPYQKDGDDNWYIDIRVADSAVVTVTSIGAVGLGSTAPTGVFISPIN